MKEARNKYGFGKEETNELNTSQDSETERLMGCKILRFKK